MPRAAFFNDASHRASTRSEYERIGRHYCVAAHKAQNDDLEPDLGWLATYCTEVRTKGGKSLALRHARAIGHHMRVNGKPNLCDHPQIEMVLFAPDPFDPLFHQVGDVGDARIRKRAQYFMDAAYNADTQRRYHREIKKCASALAQGDAAILERVSEADVFAYLENIAFAYSGHHVHNVRNAMSHFFRVRKLTDIARTERIDELVRSVRGKGARPPAALLTLAEQVNLFSALGNRPLDVRDRVLIIVIALSRFYPDTAVTILVERCHPEGEGYVIESEDPSRFGETYIGGCDDPDLDIRIWMPRLIELVRSGPLFQSLERGAFSGRPISNMAAWNALRRASVLSGTPGNALRRLKATFRQTVLEARGPTVLAKHLELKRIGSAELRVSERGRTALLEARRRKPKFKRLIQVGYTTTTERRT